MCLVRCPSRICRQVNAHVQWYRHELRVGFDLLPSHDTSVTSQIMEERDARVHERAIGGHPLPEAFRYVCHVAVVCTQSNREH